MCSLTWPVSEVVWSPGEVVGRVEAVLGQKGGRELRTSVQSHLASVRGGVEPRRGCRGCRGRTWPEGRERAKD